MENVCLGIKWKNKKYHIDKCVPWENSNGERPIYDEIYYFFNPSSTYDVAYYFTLLAPLTIEYIILHS
jgi:hypothetical protein